MRVLHGTHDETALVMSAWLAYLPSQRRAETVARQEKQGFMFA
jgi:hypothetical protein